MYIYNHIYIHCIICTYIYISIYTCSQMPHSSYKRTPRRWQPLFVWYATTFSGPLGTDLRCIKHCSTNAIGVIQDASGAHDRPRRPEGLSIGTSSGAESSGDTLEKWCPESWTNGHLRICFSSSKRLTWWYQPIYDIYIYIYIYMYVLGGWKYMKWYVYKLIE